MKLPKKQTRSKQRKEKKVSQKQIKPPDLESNPTMRFDATIHAGRKANSRMIDHLDIDRIPGPQGRVRALVTVDECVELLAEGFEVRLHQAHPVRPLDPALVATDESVRRWLDEKLLSITRPVGRKKPNRGRHT